MSRPDPVSYPGYANRIAVSRMGTELPEKKEKRCDTMMSHPPGRLLPYRQNIHASGTSHDYNLPFPALR